MKPRKWTGDEKIAIVMESLKGTKVSGKIFTSYDKPKGNADT